MTIFAEMFLYNSQQSPSIKTIGAYEFRVLPRVGEIIYGYTVDGQDVWGYVRIFEVRHGVGLHSGCIELYCEDVTQRLLDNDWPAVEGNGYENQ